MLLLQVTFLFSKYPLIEVIDITSASMQFPNKTHFLSFLKCIYFLIYSAQVKPKTFNIILLEAQAFSKMG